MSRWQRAVWKPRYLPPWAQGLLWLGFVTGFGGLVFVIDWSLVRYPGAVESPDVPEQSAPSWLWQAGVVLMTVAMLCGGIALWASRDRRPDDVDPPFGCIMALIAVGTTVAVLVPAILAAVFSPDSDQRYLPLVLSFVLAAAGTVAAIVKARTD